MRSAGREECIGKFEGDTDMLYAANSTTALLMNEADLKCIIRTEMHLMSRIITSTLLSKKI